MNTHSTPGSSKEVENVSTRVKNTKKEIEQLKTELEKLIKAGNETSQPKPPETNKPPETHVQPKKTNVVITNPNPNPSGAIPKRTQSAQPQKSPAKKTRNYDVAEARDFIKKQKEKRAEQLKAQINVVDNKVELKKEKLRELHQKTLELVSKNVQLKREKSKSRERGPPVRLDKSNPRYKSQEIAGNRVKSQERAKPQAANRMTKSCTRQKIDPNFLHPPSVNLEKTVFLESNESIKQMRRPSSSLKSQSQPSERVSRSRTRSSKREKTVLPPQTTNLTNKISTPSDSVDLNKRISHSIMTDACLKDTKETQTINNHFEGTTWLQRPPVLPYPYNFINTVKRKLQHAINSPSCVDVGVQNSEQTPSMERVKSKEEIKELLLKSTSGASHKPNLDLRTVENLGLIPSKKETISKNLFSNYDSESDTSKNVPEISSESLGSSSKPQLSFQKLKDMKLGTTNGFAEESNHGYSSDFQKESASTIRTASSPKKPSDVASSEKDQLESDTSISTISNESTNNSLVLRLSENEHPPIFINTDPRGGGDSQKTFKSLLTDGFNTTPGSISEMLNSKAISESFVLKEPPVSLTIRKSDPMSPPNKSLSSFTQKDDSFGSIQDQKSEENSNETSGKAFVPEKMVTKSDTESSVPESLHVRSGGTASLSLREPTVTLSVGKDQKRGDLVKSQMTNITIRSAGSNSNNVNEIHLKFEAEVRLLNDFNESFKQFMAVEKAFENLKNKNETNLAMTKVLQNVDTQTSILATKTATEKSSKNTTNTPASSINYSRGSEIMDELNDSIINNNNRSIAKSLQNSSLSSDWNLSNFNDSSNVNVSTGEEERSRISISNLENYNVENCAGLLSLNIFDQLIKDEDTRIQQLKAIIKIREHALLDRTRSELVWLEIQKKQLVETGKVEEASLLKKKQRGIILKHEQERNEIKKLKQMQKAASEQRKNTLKQQRNLIKSQLSTENMLSQITVKKRKERRSTGPLRVVQSCSESIHSETSISLKSSGIEDVLSITSKSLSLKVSEESELELSSLKKKTEEMPVSNAKRTLLMREAALQKRRKAAEELLRWHRKLLDEERKINELEAAATSVIKQQTPELHKYKFNGKQLNQLWRNMTGSDDRKFADEKVHVMSQMALERLCKSARQYSSKNKKRSEKKSSDEVSNYSSVFEPESVQEIINSQDEKTKISSISELIDNFSKIEDEISTLSKKSEDIVKSSQSPNRDGSEIEEIQTSEENIEEPSVIEAVEESEKISREEETEEPTTDKSEAKLSTTVEEDLSEESSTKSDPEEVKTAKSIEETPKVVYEEISIKHEEIQVEEEEHTEELKSLDKEISAIIEDQSEAKPSSKDLSLDEALESASKIEESLTKLNEKLTSEKKDEETEDVSTVPETLRTETDEKSPPKDETIISEKASARDETISTSPVSDKSSDSLSTEIDEKSPTKDETIISEKADEKISISEKSESFISTETEEKTPQKKSPDQIDVKKRVSEILAEVSPSRGDKSPRLQDLYVTAYDVGANSSEPNESLEDGRQLPTSIFGSEAEELWKKQLAIEQEIKQLELQQKEQLPYVFMREIPNKPPPPYTPPSSLSSLPQSILPSEVKEISEIASYSSKVLYKAHQNNTLDKVKFSENGFKLFSTVEVTKICAEYVFNICRDIAKDHYKQFEVIEEPSWLTVAKRPQLTKIKPSDAMGLERILNRKLKELFGFKKVQIAESAIIKWGRKKRDHVDEVLVVESQEEESQWTNFDKDELIVKNQLTTDIMKMLLEESSSVFAKIFSKKKLA